MRIATWNVNSIRTRVTRVIDFLKRTNVDILAMQEIKCKPDQFPTEPFEQAGYSVTMHGLDQWNGVAIATRLPVLDSANHFAGQPTWQDKVEARALSVTVETEAEPFTFWSLYIPNGRELTNPHYQYKLQWLAALKENAASWIESNPEALIALGGDWNVAPRDQDVWDMDAFEGNTHVSAPEREAFRAFEEAGFHEVTMGNTEGYTYWDYQKLRFPKNEGMRIDFIYASKALAARTTGAFIARDERKGKGASDHVPVIVDWA